MNAQDTRGAATSGSMSGAEALVGTLLNAGVDTCFSNPGTSELHVVSALDAHPGFRAVLTLFEGVATGAADGYARMATRPAAALLHLGPGLANGLANLHNARKGRVPVVAVVGEHSRSHLGHGAPLESDIEAIARPVCSWVRTVGDLAQVGADTAAAVAAARSLPAAPVALVLPADISWSRGARPAPAREPAGASGSSETAVAAARDALRARAPSALLLGPRALGEQALLTAGRIAAATGARLLAPTFPTRMARGPGLPTPERIVYRAAAAAAQLAGLAHLILIDAPPPVAFFGAPDRPSLLAPPECALLELVGIDGDVPAALEALLAELDGAGSAPVLQPRRRPAPPTGALTADVVNAAIGATLPEGAVLVDESLTCGFSLPGHTAGAARHDLLTLTGGAIGQGLPTALGAAVAGPDRPVLAVQADGSSLYTIQALWSMAREGLDVTVVLLNNRAYSILSMELSRITDAPPGPKARSQLSLDDPPLDFCSLARGFGVPAVRPDDAQELVDALHRAYVEPGPHLIEALVPPLF